MGRAGRGHVGRSRTRGGTKAERLFVLGLLKGVGLKSEKVVYNILKALGFEVGAVSFGIRK